MPGAATTPFLVCLRLAPIKVLGYGHVFHIDIVIRCSMPATPIFKYRMNLRPLDISQPLYEGLAVPYIMVSVASILHIVDTVGGAFAAISSDNIDPEVVFGPKDMFVRIDSLQGKLSEPWVVLSDIGLGVENNRKAIRNH